MLWGALIWIPGLAPAALAVTSSRTFGAQELGPADQGALGYWISLGVVLSILGFGGIGVLLGLALREGRLPRAGLGLWLGAMSYALGILLSAQFGSHPDFYFGLLGLPAALTAVYLLPPMPLTWFVHQARTVLLFFAYGSLLAALVAPQWAVEYPYTGGLIPGFDIRLHGLTLHANLLAPLLLTYLILGWFSPSKSRWRHVHQVVVVLAVILTQSKTVWLLLILAYTVRSAYAVWGLPRLQRYAALALAGAVISSGVLYLISWPGWSNLATVVLLSPDLPTLTGRTMIWQVTLKVWEQNPWFGYGPTLWNQQMGVVYAPLVGHVSPHAHNEFFQTLGTAGIIGAVGLLLYVLGLLAYGIRYGRLTNGVAMTLVLVTLTRGITEPTLASSPGNTIFYMHFLVFTILILASRQKSVSDEERGEYRGARSSLP
jgi:exopolysaccharide production protein ExoQ